MRGWPWLLLAVLLAPRQAASRVAERFDAPAWSLAAPWLLADGELRATVAGSSARLLVPSTSGLRRGELRVTVRQVDGAVSGLRSGVLFGAPDADNGYFLLIRGDGGYWLGKLVGGKAVPALTGLVAAVSTAGPNEIRIRWDGPQQTILLNGSRLLTRQDGSYSPAAGSVGLWVEGTGTAGFDTVEVDDPSQPDSPPTAPGTTTPPTGPDTPPVTLPGPTSEPRSDPPPPLRGPRADAGPAPVPTTTGPAPGLLEQPASGGPPSQPVTPLPGPRGDAPPTAPPDPPRVDPPRTDPPRVEPVGPTVDPTPPVTPVASGPKVLFEESFNPARYPWNEDTLRSLSDGELRIRAVDGYLLSGFPLPLSNYSYRGRARPLSAGGGTYGLVTRLQKGGRSGYLFVIRDPDLFAVARLDDERPLLLRRGEVALPPGFKDLEVECLGSTFTFKVNGAVVATFSDDRYPTGGVGLWVENHRQAAFDDLLAVEAEAAGAGGQGAGTVLEVRPDPSRTLLEERFDPPTLAWATDDQRRLQDGALWLSSSGDRFTISGAPEGRTGDWSMSVDVTRRDGPDRGLWGLVARLQPDGKTGYLCAFHGGNRFLVIRLDAENSVELARGEALLRPGVNTVTAHCDGRRLEFELNGTRLTTVEDPTYDSGGFGLYVDNGVTASFDNLLAIARRALP
ncbi:MAG: hypothetical protein IT204_19420 [Fimbriimonadaceae bacterium]|nr:hypothetical protein [Fimbriimonadaceae bacterium]